MPLKPKEMHVGFRTMEADPVNDLIGRNLPAALDTGIAEVVFGHAQLPASHPCANCASTRQTLRVIPVMVFSVVVVNRH